MKVSPIDHLNALARSMIYKKDYDDYIDSRGDDLDVFIDNNFILPQNELPKDFTNESPTLPEGLKRGYPWVDNLARLSAPAERLCKKWNISFPFDPYAEVTEDALFHVFQPISFLPAPAHWKSLQARSWVEPKNKIPSHSNEKLGTMDASHKIITHVNEKLAIMVDLSYSKKELREAFDAFLNYWYGAPSKKGPQEISLNKWEIYDKKEKEGKNRLEITRELFNIKDHPDNRPIANDKVNASYQQVKRAYDKACKILKNIEESAAT